VTKPTTINAMTDIPANIPRPIGSTEIFFPGIWKAAAALCDAEAVALSAADVPLPGEEVAVASDDDVMVGSGTDENPTIDAPGFEAIELEGVGVDEDVDDAMVMLERGIEEKTAEGTDDDAEVVVEVLSVVVDGGSEVVKVDAVDELLADCEAGVTVHCRTTCTIDAPFGPLTGVSVIVHVWVTGPAGVWIVCTVWVTTVSEVGIPCACRR